MENIELGFEFEVLLNYFLILSITNKARADARVDD